MDNFSIECPNYSQWKQCYEREGEKQEKQAGPVVGVPVVMVVAVTETDQKTENQVG